jgi:hypothetical protein
MKRVRDRGSVLIFCVVLMASVSTILMSTADVGQFTTMRQFRSEDDVRFEYIEDSLKAIFTQKALEQSLILPSNTNLTIGGFDVSVDASAGTGSRSRMIVLDATITGRKKSGKYQLVIGRRGSVSPMWFALGSETDFVPSNSVNIDGDAYFGGDYPSDVYETDISGDLYAERTSLTEEPSVEGLKKMGRTSLAANLDSSAYSAAASLSTTGNQNCNLLAFLSLGAYQTLWYNSGNVTFDVKYTGKGTVFVKGNAIIKRFERTSSADEGLIIVDGNVDLQGNAIEGFVICNGIFTQSVGGNPTITGAVWANNFAIGSKKLTVNYDSFFWDDPRWDKRMRVPGMW